MIGVTDYLLDAPRACSERRCRHGAVCQLTNGVAECVCPITCQHDDHVVRRHVDDVIGRPGNATYCNEFTLTLQITRTTVARNFRVAAVQYFQVYSLGASTDATFC